MHYFHTQQYSAASLTQIGMLAANELAGFSVQTTLPGVLWIGVVTILAVQALPQEMLGILVGISALALSGYTDQIERSQVALIIQQAVVSYPGHRRITTRLNPD